MSFGFDNSANIAYQERDLNNPATGFIATIPNYRSSNSGPITPESIGGTGKIPFSPGTLISNIFGFQFFTHPGKGQASTSFNASLVPIVAANSLPITGALSPFGSTRPGSGATVTGEDDNNKSSNKVTKQTKRNFLIALAPKGKIGAGKVILGAFGFGIKPNLTVVAIEQAPTDLGTNQVISPDAYLNAGRKAEIKSKRPASWLSKFL